MNLISQAIAGAALAAAAVTAAVTHARSDTIVLAANVSDLPTSSNIEDRRGDGTPYRIVIVDGNDNSVYGPHVIFQSLDECQTAIFSEAFKVGLVHLMTQLASEHGMPYLDKLGTPQCVQASAE